MKISKTQLRMIVKEELERTMSIREAKEKLIKTMIIRETIQYHRIHGRIDEGLKDDLAKKISAIPGISARYAKNLVLKYTKPVLMASMLSGVVSPTALAQTPDSFQSDYAALEAAAADDPLSGPADHGLFSKADFMKQLDRALEKMNSGEPEKVKATGEAHGELKGSLDKALKKVGASSDNIEVLIQIRGTLPEGYDVKADIEALKQAIGEDNVIFGEDVSWFEHVDAGKVKKQKTSAGTTLVRMELSPLGETLDIFTQIWTKPGNPTNSIQSFDF